MKHLVFFYGTLRHGRGNHHLLGDSEFIGYFNSKEGYSLIDDGLPFMIENKGGNGVFGEVYEINDNILSRIDMLEGHPDIYTREKIKVNGCFDNEEIEVWAYIYHENQGKRWWLNEPYKY